MYFKRIPQALRSGLSAATWSTDMQGVIYLTFDDGPTLATASILDILAAYNAKASFFLLGKQVESYPKLHARIIGEGHGLGNHGYAHLDGWRTATPKYLENIERGKRIIGSSDYRPPYGRMRPGQWRSVAQTERIVMWSLMPGDFDSSMDSDSCYAYIKKHVTSGDIIVLHDNERSHETVLELLPNILALFKEKGLRMEPLPSK